MKRDIAEVLKWMLYAVKGNDIELHRELSHIREMAETFGESPDMWSRVAILLDAHIGPGEQYSGWKKDVRDIWFGRTEDDE